MTFYCPIGQEMLNLVTNCCKLLKVSQAAEWAVSSTDLASVAYLSLVVRKPVFGVSDQVRHKPDCAITEYS